GGALGESLGDLARNALNIQGSTLLFIALFLFGLTVFTDLSWFKVMDVTGKITLDLIELIQGAMNRWWAARTERKQLVAQLREVDDRVHDVVAPTTPDKREQAKVKERLIEREQALSKHMSEREKQVPPVITMAPAKPPEQSKRVQKEKQAPLFVDSAVEGTLPPISILDPAEKKQLNYSPESLAAVGHLLEIKLKEFGVEVSVDSIHPGPVITRYEIQPAAGVKVSRISNLAKDLARSLAVTSVRVVEVIPGKTTVGIEIPNEDRQIVRFSEVLSTPEYDNHKSPVTLALGHDIGGKPVITDLAKMPHLLVAGTTGSGKSVGVNAMILSILFKSGPEDAKLIMIDPKMLELSIYEGIPHLLCPVVTDMKDAANALRWSVAEMERRYKLMAKMGVRNLSGFNAKVKEAEEAGTPLTDPLYHRESIHDEAPLLHKLPTIVVVVDEFADMMMIVGKKVEELIARIAQKARAAGIHLILATQRPSVDVITGLIKANIPTRMAFQVSSKIDSRTIIDQGGAEQLLGHGDMLYMPPGTSLPIRVHGAFVSDDEVHRVVEAWKLRGAPEYNDDILNGVEEAGSGFEGSSGGGDDDAETDALYDEAVQFVLESRRASISAVQRKLKIGYNRAARMIEAMEMAGVVTAMNTNGSREVLAPGPMRD
ncbi:cell division protein FtsK, partial [Pseudomonas ogarae]